MYKADKTCTPNMYSKHVHLIWKHVHQTCTQFTTNMYSKHVHNLHQTCTSNMYIFVQTCTWFLLEIYVFTFYRTIGNISTGLWSCNCRCLCRQFLHFFQVCVSCLRRRVSASCAFSKQSFGREIHFCRHFSEQRCIPNKTISCRGAARHQKGILRCSLRDQIG